ncbi:MAG: SAM-dependent methyltransferase [Candidatus Competibacteraceae bacterium]|jgi:SAM-dependent MidA family methyltransferase|nr:SAM-dependent methyltransferase [Candidatus Competibacteraceae bacterium]
MISLPEPSKPEPAALAHSTRLAEHIRAEIANNQGTISFFRFMELALYAPGLGYYSAGSAKLGADGDFVTAPEGSTLFSRCLARQCQQILIQGGGDILELGAGSGIMAADLLLELETLGKLPNCYFILELSAELRTRQQQTLAQRVPHLLERVQWLECLPDSGFSGVILGNEVLDAMPVQRFRITAEGPRPLDVSWDTDHFSWHLGDECQEITEAVNTLQQKLEETLPLGYESEFNPQLAAWLASLADVLSRGVLLLIDYGYPRRVYYHPQRTKGTLLCHYRHRAHDDPFMLPGLQDITASVDFTAVALSAVAAGLQVAGYTSQHYFLFGCGMAELLAEVDPADQRRYLEQARQANWLTLPGEMGERFKAIALTRAWDNPLCGFSLFDERHRL